MSTVMPRSVLRHRPISTQVPEWVVATPRTTRTQHSYAAKATVAHVRRLPPLVLLCGSMLTMLLLLWAVQNLWLWASIQLDTVRYGYPRTTQAAHAVGHGGLSHFIATNQDGQIYVLEVPANNVAAAHLLVGPHLLGSGADLAPVHLTFVGNAQHPDLLVEVRGIVARFHNTGSTYVPDAASFSE